jgi:hypothetical protein
MGSEKKDEGPFAQDDAKPEEEKVSGADVMTLR